MKRFTRRCWSRPSYLTVVGSLITSIPSSMTSASMWANFDQCLRHSTTLWSRLLFTFFNSWFASADWDHWKESDCYKNPLQCSTCWPHRCQRTSNQENQSLKDFSFLPTLQDIPLSTFSVPVKHFIRSNLLKNGTNKIERPEQWEEVEP